MPDWLLFLLLARDVPRIEFLEFVHRPTLRRRRYAKCLNESPVKSMAKLLLFKMCAKTCAKRARRWDLSNSKMKLDAVGISSSDDLLGELNGLVR